MYEDPSTATPIKWPPSYGRAEDKESPRDETWCFDWATFVSRLVHPIQVAVIEGLGWVERPCSATELSKLFGVDAWYNGMVSYHLTQLAEAGVLEVKSRRQVRGAEEKFFFFAEPR